MALKDLVAEAAELTEEAIERIVKDYVRYDVGRKSIVLMPPASSLSNRAKVLVYLTALNGWPFVTDDPVARDARPSELETVLGIPGGSLRPILRELAERHFLSDHDGRYSVRATTFPAIDAVLSGEAPSLSRAKTAGKRKRRAADAATNDEPIDANELDEQHTRSSRRSGTAGMGHKFQNLIDSGFFDEPRTLSDVHKQFRKEGLIVPQTSFPKYLLGAIRSGRLERDEAEVDGKTVWVYLRVVSDKGTGR